MVTIRIPAPSSMLLANLLGVLGLIAVVTAVGGLLGVWWAVLAGGAFAVALSMVAASHAAVAEVEAQKPTAVAVVRAVEDVQAA